MLLGPGGVGKTRLATELGLTLHGAFPDGSWLVELAPLFDPAFVLDAIATRLGVRTESSTPLLQRLITVLAERQVLLILDNCEHLIDECARVAEALLRPCPQLTIIATSREPLTIYGEVIYDLAPLSLPERQAVLDVEQLQQYEAISLFADRARSASREFHLQPDNAEAVEAVPLPARCGFWAEGSGVAVEVVVGAGGAATRSAIGAALEREGVPVSRLTLCDDRVELSRPYPLRCELREAVFSPARAARPAALETRLE
jgi:hypothetical protein